jgi:hypothetical protein
MRHLLKVVTMPALVSRQKTLLENAFSVVTESCAHCLHNLCLKRKTILGFWKYLIFGMTIISLCEDINVFKLIYHLRT